ncbi:MAG: class I SAM-dependent methyltransferase [Acidimicrobiia bacterium]
MTDPHRAASAGPGADELLDEQVAYYRARAPVYDDWWEGRGSYLRSPGLAAAWRAERDGLEDDLRAWAAGLAGASVLELAAGTGNLTRLVAPHAARVTAVDTSPEALSINRAKLGRHAGRVGLVRADLFAWEPARAFDAVLFGFWISHVPPGRWERFWTLVRRSLRPGGRLWFCDNAHPRLAWVAGVLPRQDGRIMRGDGAVDLETGVHLRSLPDGRSFRVVKRFPEPADLERDLAARGLEVQVGTTEWAFVLGRGRRS